MMKIFNNLEEFVPTLLGSGLAIGNFDGLHLGHQAVIRNAIDIASIDGRACGVMSFEPPPSSFFHPQKKQYRLSFPATKAHYISQLGASFLLNLPFDEELAAMTAEDFVEKILNQKLKAKNITVGGNFRFGKGRGGNSEFLKKNAAGEVKILAPIIMSGETVSSTSIRNSLLEGKPQKAAELLGRWWQIDGIVIKGEQRGRTIQFPTLNIALNNYAQCAYGVYVVRCFVKNKWFDGVANIGLRPTLANLKEPLLEVHLFDVEENFYDAKCQVFLLDFIRIEQKFNGLDELKIQITDDCKKATARLAELKNLPDIFGKIE